MRALKAFVKRTLPLKKVRPFKYRLLFLVAIIIFSDLAIVLQPFVETKTYALGKAEQLLTKKNDQLATKLKYDKDKQSFTFSSSSATTKTGAGITGTGNVSANFNQDLSKGISVTDSTNNVALSMMPLQKYTIGQKDENRVVYPMTNGHGWAVYTAQTTGVKEDVILTSSATDTTTLSYTLSLGDGLIAKIEPDGSIGVYGNTLLSGQITASSDADAKLLASARQHAKKNNLLFTIPKPTVVEASKTSSAVKANYVLNGSKLDVQVSGLAKAAYPLSIDPTIFVSSAQQFMAGNNETNINFNVDQQLIEKGRTTGARFDSWTGTTNLPSPTWASGVAAAGGYIYSVGGNTFQGQVFNSQGADSYIVPSGVTSLTLKLWGGGGGAGGGGATAAGGAGGSGGYTLSTISVTPGETLSVYVGGGGSGGLYSSAGNGAGGGGGGGGFTSIYRGSTLLALAAGGGGAGGGRQAYTGGNGGPGGGTSGGGGVSAGNTNAGGAGSQTTGGFAGSGGQTAVAGSSLAGGDGADGRTTSTKGSGASGGAASGGNGGAANLSTTRAGGGAGGAGYFGGGGGGSSANSTSGAGAGGGGGSSYTVSGSTNVTNTAGSGVTPANSTDAARNGAATGGTAGAAKSSGGNGAGGIAVVSYGSGSLTTSAVNWAQFNTSTGTVDSANPGSGACSGWCTNTSYGLPSARSNFSLVAYSGYLYAFGGLDSSGNRTNSVYIAKLGANGEPQLWHPTNTSQSSWVYWYQDTNLSSVRSDMGIAAYNNRMYLIGGRSTNGPVGTTEIANINPNGTLGSWSTSTALPSALYGHSVKIYNDRIYVIGGATSVGGSPLSTIRYNKINSDGTLNSWSTTTSMPEGRMNNGGDFATIWGAYLYVSGGCTTVNSNGYCTSILSTTKVASINADGSLDTWSNMAGVTDQRTGSSIVSWKDNVYEVGGCSTQNATSGDCNGGMIGTIFYGSINQDGDASTVDQSVGSGNGTCSGSAPIECDLPGTNYIGDLLNSSFITNGYLYVVGGCTNNTCSTTLGNVAYVAISSTGQMSKPATCPNGAYQGSAWCVDTTNTISGGIAAASPVVFNNRVYMVGGLNGNNNTNTIAYTNLNADGSITAWTSQSMTGLGLTSVSYLFSYARSNPVSAGTNPGNLYVFGGCATSSAAGCTAYSQNVYKCNIQTAGAIAGCTTNGQMQIGIVPGDTATGLGIMSGTVYANYIYLIGGVSPNQQDLKTVRYAKFDDSNNVVTAGASGWTESPNQMAVGRRRASAFGYNGYIYVVGGYEASSGVLADIEFVKVNVSDGSIGDNAGNAFKVSAVTISQRWGLSVPVSNSFAYVIGGCIVGASPSGCTSRTDTIQTFQIYNNDSGAPAGYTTSANTWGTSPSRTGAGSTIQNGYIYIAGGCTSTSDCTNAISDVSYAAIDVNGTIGTWSQATAGLPAVRTKGKLLSTNGGLYYVGGQSSTSTDQRTEVYYAVPNANGNITAWSTSSNGLPAARTNFGATVWNNRLYVIGGEGSGTGCSNGVCNTTYVSPTVNGGNITSAWSSTSTPFDVARSGATAVAYANNLYLMGGYDGSNYLSDVQYSKISPTTGTAGNWVFTASLPGPVAGADGFAANGYLYLLGGKSSATSCDPSSLVAPISANTTIASGNNPTGIGEWYETNQKYGGARYGAAAVYSNGKAYILGGACGTTLTYASPVTQQTTLLSQPQVARYSISIDTDSDVYPAYWLLNGVDNAIGAKWQLRYRSMTNPSGTLCTSPAMTTWGQETVFGDVTLGLPGVYTPKDSSGTTTNCARFFYFNVSVDSSQAFGYPDDVTRGPTITDLTLQFTADPSKRLIHGKTFTGGLQQPVDAPLYAN